MNEPMLLALGAFMLALVHALVMEGWRTVIRSAMQRPDGGNSDASPSVSVIIPARDAESTIGSLLQDLYGQDMPRDRYEVIVVDDHSADGTSVIVGRMMRSWEGLRMIQLENEHGKKAAIMRAAAEAYHDLIVITDADCRCGSSRLSAISGSWSELRPDMLLMPVETCGRKGLIGGVQRMEQLALQAVAIGSGAMGYPVLANGANMAFSRATFFQLNGYKNDRWASGDDMFLLQRMRRARKRLAYLTLPEVVVSVAAESTWRNAYQQRLRWAGKMRSYRDTMVMFTAIAGLLFPWLLIVVTWHVMGAVEPGQGMVNTSLLLICAWMFWMLPIIRLVIVMDDFFTHAAARNGLHHAAKSSLLTGLSTIPALIAFMIYAPLIAIVSIFVRPIWKGRRV